MEKNSSWRMLLIAIVIIVAVFVGMILIKNREVDTDVTAKTTKVGLIITGKKDDANFCQAHYDALMKLKDELNLDIICKEGIPEDETCRSAIKELIEHDGCRIIIGASFGYGEQLVAMAKQHPEIYFFHPFGSEKLTNLTSCTGRMYQAKYLAGIVAGMRTETGQMGYIASFPYSEVIRDINSFALGVRSVLPDAQIYVKYCNSWVDDEAARAASVELLDRIPDIDILFMHTNSIKPNYIADERGIWSIGLNKDNSELFPDSYLTACEWQWDIYYRAEILSCLQGKFYGKVEWLDMESGVLGLSPLTGNVAPGTAEMVEKASKRFINRSFDVFYGPVVDNNGVLRVPKGDSMSEEEMLNRFDWFVEGVKLEE